jgi:FMNH2-dependent dimethyl sulfone monooxygenase
MEGSTLDCIAMTAFFAAHTRRIRLVTAIHPGFFLPAPIAKWGATLDLLTAGRWGINVTSGWHLDEFPMYGATLVEHDQRYARSREFIDVLRGAWSNDRFGYAGKYYSVKDLKLEPRPTGRLVVFQGGQSDAAIAMASTHSDWMFLNGGPPERVAALIQRARAAATNAGRTLRFAMYAQPLCRTTDAEAWREIDARIAAIDPELAARRRVATSGAQGMWATDDPLSMLDTNEGFSARLIGSPESVWARIQEFARCGVEMFHLDLRDKLFVDAVLPRLISRTDADAVKPS